MYKGVNPSKGVPDFSDPFAGLPEELRDPDVPAFMRANYRRESTVGGLVGAVQEQLREGGVFYIRGGDGVLVSEAQLKELRGLGVGIGAKGPNVLVKLPSPGDVVKIFSDAYQTLDTKMPSDYQEEARKRLGEIEPKFAGTLEEAAAAFGQVLPTQPQE